MTRWNSGLAVFVRLFYMYVAIDLKKRLLDIYSSAKLVLNKIMCSCVQ